MCELYAMTGSEPSYIYFTIGEFRRHGGDTADNPDGWGLAYIMEDQVDIYRRAEAGALSHAMEDIIQHHQPAKTVMSHIRKASKDNIALENTHPFHMELGGKKHVFMHNGDLTDPETALPLSWYEPEGSTDSEVAFGYLMEQMTVLWANGAPALDDRIECILQAFHRISDLGIANLIYHDGDYLFAYGNHRTQANGKVEPPGLWYLDHHWDSDEHQTIKGLSIAGQHHDQLVVASVPLTKDDWKPFNKNQMLVASHGVLVHST